MIFRRSNIVNTTSRLKDYCKNLGADLIGIADLEPMRKGLPIFPQNLLDCYKIGISIGICLKDEIIEEISDRPTPKYAQHYKEINSILDGVASQIVQWIVEKGFAAKHIPASFIVDETKLLGSISHKAVARMAGLGWQGKSLLIINPEYGPRFRLVTILTDMSLIPDYPIKNKCGTCNECVQACPASAIKNVSTESHYLTRDIAIDLKRCNEKLNEFKDIPDIGASICGVCIKVCPYGKR